jgi:uncharacterized protein YhaN
MDLEKTMQFILDVQARLEASAQQHEGHLAKLESSMAAASGLIGRLAQAEIRMAERMEDIGERMTTGFQKLREIQATTEYKLNALIDTVDKLVRRNGHKE